MRVVYPVIFTDVGSNILIEVPDLSILTEANEEGKEKGTIAEAIAMTRDAIGLTCISREDCGEEIPKPTEMELIKSESGTFADEGKGIVSLVDVDLVEYRKKVDNRAVRRNVTLPNWLNVEAEKAHLNVSKVLQDALISVLGVSR